MIDFIIDLARNIGEGICDLWDLIDKMVEKKPLWFWLGCCIAIFIASGVVASLLRDNKVLYSIFVLWYTIIEVVICVP